jgi:hypothetical protein
VDKSYHVYRATPTRCLVPLFGHGTVVFTVFWHYFVGVTIHKMNSIFNVLFYFKGTAKKLKIYETFSENHPRFRFCVVNFNPFHH